LSKNFSIFVQKRARYIHSYCAYKLKYNDCINLSAYLMFSFHVFCFVCSNQLCILDWIQTHFSYTFPPFQRYSRHSLFPLVSPLCIMLFTSQQFQFIPRNISFNHQYYPIIRKNGMKFPIIHKRLVLRMMQMILKWLLH